MNAGNAPMLPHRAAIAAGLFTLVLAFACGAEVLQFKDGTKVEGTVRRTLAGYDVTDLQGNVTHVAAEDVLHISVTTRPVSPLEAESRLLSLRRAADNLSDLAVIVDRYNHFIEANQGSPSAHDAERDLAAWRERQEKRMVKIGTNWVLPAERNRLRAELPNTATQARLLMTGAHAKEAQSLIQRGLEVEPTDPSLQFLRGVTLFRQDQLQDSRKAFDTVTATFHDHAPSLNNVAVILWRQNQPMGALNVYIRAMSAAPSSRLILDNVAEALHALPTNQRGNAVAVRAAKIFALQDADLQHELAANGLVRWGSTWVTQLQRAKLEAIEKDINAKLDQMSADYDGVKAKVDQIESDYENNVKAMRAIEQTSYAVDAQGNAFRLPLPARYHDLERENRQLTQDRVAGVEKLESMRVNAKKLQAQLPTPRFTGMLNVIGAEGTPGLPPLAAAPKTAEAQPESPLPKSLTMPKELPTPASAPYVPPLPAGIGEPTTRSASTRSSVPGSTLTPN